MYSWYWTNSEVSFLFSLFHSARINQPHCLFLCIFHLFLLELFLLFCTTGSQWIFLDPMLTALHLGTFLVFPTTTSAYVINAPLVFSPEPRYSKYNWIDFLSWLRVQYGSKCISKRTNGRLFNFCEVEWTTTSTELFQIYLQGKERGKQNKGENKTKGKSKQRGVIPQQVCTSQARRKPNTERKQTKQNKTVLVFVLAFLGKHINVTNFHLHCIWYRSHPH